MSRRHCVAGHLRLATLEHRVQEALSATTSDDLSAVTCDRPALDDRRWEESAPNASRRDQRCRCVFFRAVPAVVIVLDEDPQSWVIGRSSGCDVVLRDPAVSRRQAVLSVRGGRCSLRDLRSTNGLRVNGQRVVTAVLAPGDVVSFADAVHAVVS